MSRSLFLCSLAPAVFALSLSVGTHAPPTTRLAAPGRLACSAASVMMADAHQPQNVGEAKAAFQAAYPRPVSALANGFVNEMLTGITLASLSPAFKYTRIFALGFEALCETFLEALPEEDRKPLRDAMCVGLGLDETKLAKDAASLKAELDGKAEEDAFACTDFETIKGIQNYKYSYVFGAGVLSLMPVVGTEVSKEAIDRWSDALGLRPDRLQKDWAFYEAATTKLVEVRQMMMEMQASTKRKEAQKLREEAEKAAREADEAEKALSS